MATNLVTAGLGAKMTERQMMVASFAPGVVVLWRCALQRGMWGKIFGVVLPFPNAVLQKNAIKLFAKWWHYWVVICQSNKYVVLSA